MIFQNKASVITSISVCVELIYHRHSNELVVLIIAPSIT